jgi:carbamoyl-phosphate synthase large subunit
MQEKVFIVGVDCNKYNLVRAETDKKYLIPRADDSKYIDMLNSIIEEEKIDFVHAQNDEEVGCLSQNRDTLKAKMFLPSKESVNICLDKFKSYEIWDKAGIKLPKTFLINNKDDLKKAFAYIGSDVWLRDVKGAAGNGSFPTNDVEKAIAWINLKNGWGHFTAAERLTEKTVTWMSIWKDGELVVAQGRKRLSWELGNRAPSGVTGVTGVGETYSDPNLDDLSIRAIKAIDAKPNGIWSVDMTYDKNGVPNPTEINIGRFFTTHLFFTEAGLNMPEILIKLAFGEEVFVAKKLNPLQLNLFWIRGVDFLPILTELNKIENYEKEFEERIKKLDS